MIENAVSTQRIGIMVSAIFTSASLVFPLSVIAAENQEAEQLEDEVIMMSSASQSDSTEYIFDPQILKGTGFAIDYSGFIDGGASADGHYLVDIIVNQRVFNTNQTLSFTRQANGSFAPCLPVEFWQSTQLKLKKDYRDALVNSVSEKNCTDLNQLPMGVELTANLNQLALEINIPQVGLIEQVAGDNRAEWNYGSNAAFVNYDVNLYSSRMKSVSSWHTNGYLGLSSGINLGRFQLRHRAALTLTKANQNTEVDWSGYQTYLQTIIPDLDSYLRIGDSYSSNSHFGSSAFVGVQLKSEPRMKPYFTRSYAPVITGIALRPSTVTVKQKNVTIYQISVPAGPFEISDLTPTRAYGDLRVEIMGDDGQTTNYSVPFSATPDSLRPGVDRYELSIGKLADTLASSPYLIDAYYARGINNWLSLNAGGRASRDYYALSSGAVLGSSFGAFGITGIYSNSNLGEDNESGWKLGLDYSKSFNFGTNIALASFWYSTKGYRDLHQSLNEMNKSQALNLAEASRYSEYSTRQKTYASVNISQQLQQYGQLVLNGILTQYRDDRPTSKQLQIGYSNSWGEVSYNLSYLRQFSGHLPLQDDEQFMLTLSVPFNFHGKRFLSSVGVSTSSLNGESYNGTLTHLPRNHQDPVYSVNANYETLADHQSNRRFGVNASKQFDHVQFNAGASTSDHSYQVNAGARGAFVAHGGGVNMTNTLGESFAIVEAKKAQGAKMGFTGAKIDDNGYGIINQLSAFSPNVITVDTNALNSDVELIDNGRSIVPIAGSAVTLDFVAKSGISALFKIRLANGEMPPLGAVIKDDQAVTLGYVGQGGQGYIRLQQPQGRLHLSWADNSCRADYVISASTPNKMHKQELSCE
ncbi:fimbria/pilus outer membrane usher protein [Shewanella fidelis]|uniref:Fimbrial biogenesis outer membrane usher protein n=1 Tax=Shewanella fidelis TaxID=173509 RepID=A0AAW8NKN1_9GAMM|nr:fimbria/pilus outer membrane usher protein [Shewanella fidelis]MDR8523823.1 fimbrial biogenesis outer membrane usher protein [Shewanella fidelis]MDW4810371.1 fimbrial biogenesis outer membrane usher protein [Shewanella fidelis]MDW4814516.1 fimbrial biogenesis outer membrane usher protein [Shewanella fidelis]MDW4818606.1 fimbrial biogenesis outer membrane usher protein [Shewanella fidelis]MDW4823741.1 fimbrial biogenesis outer membrane usher protein [Shewanella fidelis]